VLGLPFWQIFLLILVGCLFWRSPHLIECWKHFLDYRQEKRNAERKFALDQKKLELEVTKRIERARGRKRS